MILSDRDKYLTAILVGVFIVCAPQLFFKGSSADLMAVWMAADRFAAGLPQAIYSTDATVFEMLPPSKWHNQIEALQYVGQYYPYVYPPLIAATLAPLTQMLGYEAFVFGVSIVNSALLMGCVLLAARAARSSLPLVAYASVAVMLLCLSSIALLAMQENQPQILVTFLIVLAIERSVAGHLKSAGVVMALAAAIKVYPALFILIWVVRREWSAVKSFVVAGLMLAGLSVLIAGWPLHQAFLDQLSSISRTALVTGWSYNMNSLYAQLFLNDALVYVEPAAVIGEETRVMGWHVVEKTPVWQLASGLVGLALVVGVAVSMLYRPYREVPLWVAMVGILALFSPISWIYYYIPLLLFMPLFLERYGYLVGGFLILCTVGCTIITVPAMIFERLQDGTMLLSLQVTGILIGTLAFAVCPSHGLGRKST